MVLELLIYDKSAINFFDQSAEAAIVVMWLPKFYTHFWGPFFSRILNNYLKYTIRSIGCEASSHPVNQ